MQSIVRYLLVFLCALCFQHNPLNAMKRPRTDLSLLSEERIPKKQATERNALIPQKYPRPITEFPQLVAMQEIATKKTVKSTVAQAQKCPRPAPLQLDSAETKRPRCKICLEDFACSQNLKVHMRIHTGEKPYSCQICPKSFTQKSILTRHIKTHTQKKPYSCDECEKSFARSDKLIRHKITHTNATPSYQCHLCPKKLLSKKGLEIHIATHSDERPFKCDLCEQQLCTESGLHRHMQIHEQKTVQCSLCKNRFSSKDSLTRHHTRFHSN